MRKLLVAPFILSLLATVWLGCSEAPPPQRSSRPDVLLISIDTLRDDHLGIYGYPRPTSDNIDRWFADAAIFERSYSAEANTPPSVVSMLTGKLPSEHGLRRFYALFPKDMKMISDMMPADYERVAFVSNNVLTDEAMGLASHFDHYDDYVSQREPYRKVFERDARTTTDAVLHWLETERDYARPLFLWVHYIDPHGPYHPVDDWEFTLTHDEPLEIDIERVPDYQREPGITDGLTYVDRYDEEIRFLDTQVGRLLDGYDRDFSVDDALVIFTADHGESMMEHDEWFTHGHDVYEEVNRVPLMVRGPGVIPGRYQPLVSGIDIAPTILNFVGEPVPEDMSQIDLRKPEAIPDDRIVYLAAFPKRRAAVQGTAKRMWGPRGSPPTCYDLASDPKELSPQPCPEGDPLVAALDALVNRTERAHDVERRESGVVFETGERLENPKISPRATKEDLEKLRALGYVQ